MVPQETFELSLLQKTVLVPSPVIATSLELISKVADTFAMCVWQKPRWFGVCVAVVFITNSPASL
jgi:hypothetical protein